MLNISPPITEIELRRALLRTLEGANYLSERLVVEELFVDGRGARVDVAVITDSLVGFEIKSDFDNYNRLSNQVHAFNRVFEQITIVVASSHASKVDQVVPSWWGIVVADRDEKGEVQLYGIRHPTKNQLRDTYSLASLLWRDEAIDVLSSVAPSASMLNKNKGWLFDQLSHNFNVEQLTLAVTTRLKHRKAWRDRSPFAPSDDLLHLAATS